MDSVGREGAEEEGTNAEGQASTAHLPHPNRSRLLPLLPFLMEGDRGKMAQGCLWRAGDNSR